MTGEAKQTVGRYEVIRSLGKGAQGSVYLGRDPTLDRLVAIKVLTSNDSELNSITDGDAPLEARMSSKLKHPNIVPIFDAGKCPVGPYLVFEYVEGKTLAQALKTDGALSIETAVPLISAILKAVATAHTAGIVHLDLSTRNVLIDADNVPRVMDFGLAQHVSVAREPKDFATGTLRYMAPEQFVGQALGPGTDVFALGSTFYELVTGKRAMDASGLKAIRYKIIHGKVDFGPLQTVPHGEAFARFLAGAFEKSQDGRYADGSVMSEAFELFLNETGLAESQTTGASHSTIEFLLRRMNRTGDFPTISRTLSDINRLTRDDSNANADKLANVILRDFALTGKLLKLVNSAFYGTRTSEITSISHAVVFLGVEKVRMTANSLTFFSQMKGDSDVLKDSMTKSFLSGLMARHLALRDRLPKTEEAFICGMCQNLGENLVIFYFADEFEEINELQQAKALSKFAAARGVLGVGYPELGAAVAKSWNLPRSIIAAIIGVPPGLVHKATDDVEQLRNVAVLANELCDLFLNHEPEDVEAAMLALLERFKASVKLDRDYCVKLIHAAFEKLKQFAPIFEINVAASHFCQSVQSWLDLHMETSEVEDTQVETG